MTTQQAKIVWQKAAQLQAQSAHQLESSTLPTDSDDLPTENRGYELRHVEAAAEDVGISRRFVAMAVAQIEQADGGELSIQGPPNWIGRSAPFWLGTDETGFVVRRRVDSEASKVLKVMGDVWRRDPFSLVLRKTVGAHPLDGGVLVFELPTQMSDTAVVSQWMLTRFKLEIKQLSVTIAARGRQSCEIEVRADLVPGYRNNILASGFFTGLMGTAGTGGSIALGLGVGTALTFLAAPALLVGGALGAGTLAWYRWLYRRSVDQSKKEIDRAITQLGSEIQSFAVFGERPSLKPVSSQMERPGSAEVGNEQRQ